jgi:hypothetical protein
MLVEQAVPALDDAKTRQSIKMALVDHISGLWPVDPGSLVLDVFELQKQLVGVTVSRPWNSRPLSESTASRQAAACAIAKGLLLGGRPKLRILYELEHLNILCVSLDAGQPPRVELTGFVSDLRPHFAAAAVVVVPLRLGGCTRLKIV